MKKDFVIAISGKSGCGNSTVSRLVGETLGINVLNYTFHTMAKEKNIPFDEILKLAQNDSAYDLLLDQRQKTIAASGRHIIATRLAIWIIDNADLRVYINATPKVRYKRIASRDQLACHQAEKKTIKRDKQDSKRYKDLYNIDNNNYQFADLIVNSDNLDQYQISKIIIAAAKTLVV